MEQKAATLEISKALVNGNNGNANWEGSVNRFCCISNITTLFTMLEMVQTGVDNN